MEAESPACLRRPRGQSGEIGQARGLPTGNAEWAQQGLNLRPLPCELDSGGWQPSAGVIKSAQSLDLDTKATSMPLPVLASFSLENAPYEPQPLGESTAKKQGAKVHSELPICAPALLTVSDVARVLRKSSATVYRLCALGELPARRVGNQIWIAPDDLARLLQRQRDGRKGFLTHRREPRDSKTAAVKRE